MSYTSGVQIKSGDNCSSSVRDIYINSTQQIKPRCPYDKEDFNFIPPLDDSLFVGRDIILEKLTDLFFMQDKRKAVIYGLAGYGKTEIAKRFVTQCKIDKINHVLWMDASRPEDLKKSLRNIAQQLNFENCEDETLISRVFNCFKPMAEKTIIVYDNASDQQTILEYDQYASNFFRVITTKIYWADGTQELNELSPKFALEILHNKLHDYDSYIIENAPLFEKLVDILGGVPLALQIIGSIIEYKIKITKGKFCLKKYIKKLEQKEEEFLDKSAEKYSSISYKNSLYQAMKISLNEIAVENELALNILFVCSYLNSEQIYLSMLKEIEIISELLQRSDDEEEEFENALIQLSAFLFIELDADDKISIHRFVQKVVRYHVSKCDTQFQNKIYGACLKLTLSNEHYFHIPSIIMRADTYTTTFFNFYIEHFEIYKTNGEYTKLKSWIAKCTGLQLILEILIEGKCKKSLEKILDHLNPKTRDYINEFNLLHVAAMVDDVNIFSLLLIYEPLLDKIDRDGHCALHGATFKWNEEIINLLIKFKAKITITDNNGGTLLHTFIRGGYYIDSVDIEQMKRIIRQIKGTQQIKEIMNASSGESLLHEAASAVRPELVKLLINDYGIDANVQDKLGYTPLHNLILKASISEVNEQRVIDTAKLFLRNNAFVDIPNIHGTTPLQYAISREVVYLKDLFNDFIAADERCRKTQQ